MKRGIIKESQELSIEQQRKDEIEGLKNLIQYRKNKNLAYQDVEKKLEILKEKIKEEKEDK